MKVQNEDAMFTHLVNQQMITIYFVSLIWIFPIWILFTFPFGFTLFSMSQLCRFYFLNNGTTFFGFTLTLIVTQFT